MQVFVITSTDAAARQERATRQLNAAGIDYQFVPAIPGEQALKSRACKINEREFLLNTGKRATPSQIGSFVSHRLIWKMCVSIDEPVLVMEDEFHINGRFPAAIELTTKNVEEYGFIRLQSEKDAKKHRERRLGLFNLWRYTKAPYGTVCYAVSPRTAAKLVEHAATITAPVEVYLRRFWTHGQRMFGLTPYTVADPVAKISGRKPDSEISEVEYPTTTYQILKNVRELFVGRAVQ